MQKLSHNIARNLMVHDKFVSTCLILLTSKYLYTWWPITVILPNINTHIWCRSGVLSLASGDPVRNHLSSGESEKSHRTFEMEGGVLHRVMYQKWAMPVRRATRGHTRGWGRVELGKASLAGVISSIARVAYVLRLNSDYAGTPFLTPGSWGGGDSWDDDLNSHGLAVDVSILNMKTISHLQWYLIGNCNCCFITG